MMRKILHERRCYFFEVVFFFFPVDDAFFVGDFFCFVVSSFFDRDLLFWKGEDDAFCLTFTLRLDQCRAVGLCQCVPVISFSDTHIE